MVLICQPILYVVLSTDQADGGPIFRFLKDNLSDIQVCLYGPWLGCGSRITGSFYTCKNASSPCNPEMVVRSDYTFRSRNCFVIHVHCLLPNRVRQLLVNCSPLFWQICRGFFLVDIKIYASLLFGNSTWLQELTDIQFQSKLPIYPVKD